MSDHALDAVVALPRSSVEVAVLDDSVVIMATAQAEDSQEFRSATAQVLALGYAQVSDEYWDTELDRYVYVFTNAEGQH